MNLRQIKAIPWHFQLIVIFYAVHTSVPVIGFYTPAAVNASANISHASAAR